MSPALTSSSSSSSVGGEFVAHVFAEEVQQEDRHDPALVLGDQAVLVLADVFAVLDRGDDRGIGRGPADAQLFHRLTSVASV
jgi:hypothetical protein